jgi:atypical dual specificity phosphatase
VAFKVPLKQELTVSETVDTKFGIAELVQTLPQLGLVIDLTNTKRYYNPEEFRKHSVKYCKIATMGHEVPDRRLVQQFFRVSKSFLKDYPEKLIGVHCTHGVNRTGYFICSFMILESELAPNIAIDKFGEARGHPIERANYLTSLRLLNHLSHSKSLEREPAEVPSSHYSRYSWRRQDTDQSRAMPYSFGGSNVGGPRRRVAYNNPAFTQPYDSRQPQYNNAYGNNTSDNWRDQNSHRPNNGRDFVRRPRPRHHNSESTNGTYGGSSYY